MSSNNVWVTSTSTNTTPFYVSAGTYTFTGSCSTFHFPVGNCSICGTLVKSNEKFTSINLPDKTVYLCSKCTLDKLSDVVVAESI